MTIELTLQIFMLPDDLAELQEMDEKFEIDEADCHLKQHTFYSIDTLYPTSELHCMIVSGGMEYQVNATYEEVKSLIKDQLIFRWN